MLILGLILVWNGSENDHGRNCIALGEDESRVRRVWGKRDDDERTLFSDFLDVGRSSSFRAEVNIVRWKRPR